MRIALLRKVLDKTKNEENSLAKQKLHLNKTLFSAITERSQLEKATKSKSENKKSKYKIEVNIASKVNKRCKK